MSKLLRYKGWAVNGLGLPASQHHHKPVLKSKREYSGHQHFISTFGNTAPKNLIVMYDISDSKKSEREWLLRQLKKFDYILVQKSVLVGPSPLPKDFLDYVKSIGLVNQLKFLKLAVPYSSKNKIS